MVRASKLPYQNFDYNLRRAKALAHLDGYLEDLFLHQGRGTIGAFLNLPAELMKITGMDELLKGVEKDFEIRAKEHFQARYDSETIKKEGQEIGRRLKPHINKLSQIFEDLNLVMSSTLTEQALVLAVSAFEVYLREITASIVALNPSVRRKFHQEIEEGLTRTKLEEYEEDAKRTQGEIVAELVRLDPNRLRSMLRKLLGIENMFAETKVEKKFGKILECRHIVIHRAGLIDPKFKKVTKFKGAIDSKVKISRRYVLQSISLLERLAKRVEMGIPSTRNR